MRIDSVVVSPEKRVCGITFATIQKNGLKYMYETHISHVYFIKNHKNTCFFVCVCVASDLDGMWMECGCVWLVFGVSCVVPSLSSVCKKEKRKNGKTF